MEAMLSGPDVPEDLAAGLQPAADILAALRARPSGDELAGEAFAMAEFRNRVGAPVPVRRSRPRRRHSFLTSLLSAKVAVVAAAAAIAAGGVATAAYARALPAPVQRIAHDFIGAPAEPHVSHPSGSSTAPGRTGSRRHFRHHFVGHGCWSQRTHPSWMTKPHPSFTPMPRPTCTPAPRPSFTPKPHRSFMPGKFRHDRRHRYQRYPVHGPGPRPTGSPAPRPTSTPSPQPSAMR
jgi:hypothetical protein